LQTNFTNAVPVVDFLDLEPLGDQLAIENTTYSQFKAGISQPSKLVVNGFDDSCSEDANCNSNVSRQA
jgi:deoxycytidylate deaminase